MLKFRADRRVSHYDRRQPVTSFIPDETLKLQLQQHSSPDMSCKPNAKRPVNTASEAVVGNGMVSELSTEKQPSRSSRKAATFGKRSNSMRRNPKAEVNKQGWLYKQASSGVKQWSKRWFVLTDRCLFYYKDEKEEVVLGSIPLLSFRVSTVQPSDNISRKHAFKAEHAGTRTYYFSADSREEQESWVQAMSDAARVHIPPAQRNNTENIPPADLNHISAGKGTAVRQRGEGDGRGEEAKDTNKQEVNGLPNMEAGAPTTPMTPDPNGRAGETGSSHPNGWVSYGAPGSAFHPKETRENAVLRRGFVPRTQPERLAQRKSSMTQLQQWVNLRRGRPTQEDMQSPTHYYAPAMPRGGADYYDVYGPQYVEDYGMYPPGVRPDSFCSVPGAYERIPPQWVSEEKQRAMYPQDRSRDMAGRGGGGYHWTGHMPSNQQSLYYAQNSLRRLTLQPRSRSVPRSPSQGPYAAGSRAFSPVRSPSARFERHHDNMVYAEPVYSMRRSISSPKHDYPGERRSMSPGLYHYNYPASPTIQEKMEDILDLQLQRNLEYLDRQVTEGDRLISVVQRLVENSSPRAQLYTQVSPFHENYRDISPVYRSNDLDVDKLLGQLCEQNRVLKDQELTVQRLRVDKDGLEGALGSMHQEMELYRGQGSSIEKLLQKKESLQNQLINIRGELSQATNVMAATRVEFEALEDEVLSVHRYLHEQLLLGNQSEHMHRQIQKELWRIQDVLEGLHKNNPSRGTNTAKQRVTSGPSGSFSTNSPASPLSSVSLTSPLSPFSPASGSQGSPSKHVIEKFTFQSESSTAANSHQAEHVETDSDRQNKVGVVPPRTKSPAEENCSSPAQVTCRNSDRKLPNGHLSRERPKSAVFPAEIKSKMSVEEQIERIKRNQSASMREKRRSLQLTSSQQIDGMKPAVNYRVVRRRLTAHEVDIKDLEAAVRGEGIESPREEIARLRRLDVEPESYSLDIGRELSTPDKVLIPERYLEPEPEAQLSPDELREKKKKVERIKTLIAKSTLQNIVPLLDGPADGQVDTEQQLQEQEKRIEISCALAAEASRRSRLLSAQCISPSPPSSPIADLTDSTHFMKV
ncbi:pleckstrin homology domain-containing family A member 6 isoform X2 [Polypterus senegalus]|uniref:pleckstrin homology domain-containing family A member 6 isoform X2 n=1 Tax=Polypterus senegalus TaxID=55291 RepID=UPI00196518CC|nr:pleckstrin homology domain-containing family A member 6 isoform X2 [Polypterus senegalus]